jgi:hypothetical protein
MAAPDQLPGDVRADKARTFLTFPYRC